MENTYLKTYQNKRRLKSKSLGICQNCHIRKVKKNRFSCVRCLVDKRINLIFHSSNGRDLYKKLNRKQDGKCAICEKKSQKLQIDHKHGTTEVRGLLCSSCNRGLGMFEDSPIYLERARKYLVKSCG